jgi:hypothetical protein
MGGDERAITAVEEDVWSIIENAKLPIEVNEAVAKVLDDYYSSLSPPEDIDPGNDGPLPGEFEQALDEYENGGGPLSPQVHCDAHKHFEYDCIDCSDAREQVRTHDQ